MPPKNLLKPLGKSSIADLLSSARPPPMRCNDLRPGLGFAGLMNLQKFVQQGGVLITVDDTASFAVNYGFTPGVSIARPNRLKAVGDILRMKTIDAMSPIAYGYADSLAMYCANGPVFNLSNVAIGGGGRRRSA